MVTSTGNRGVVCATDSRATLIEDLQLTAGVGPCIDAIASGGPVLVPDLDEPDIVTERWPAFMEGPPGPGSGRSSRSRCASVPSPLVPSTFTATGPATSPPAAFRPAGGGRGRPRIAVPRHRRRRLRRRYGGHAAYQLQVHQATGMVRVQLGVTIEEAFLMLRARAFAAGRPVAEVASDVVERRLRFTTEDQ